ncbi:MAG: APC family permease [Candidatus Acidiferrales bacterium]
MRPANLPTEPSAQAPFARKRIANLTLWPLVAATFFMVSGGAYGTEDIIHGAGYGLGIVILLLTPILWSVPTALMVGELASALPHEGGYYAWVRRGMGNFWGFQEAWLSLVASIFDMAIYPTLFVAYLQRLFPWFAAGRRGMIVGLTVVAISAAWNILGVRAIGISSFWLFLLLSAPFALIVILAPMKIGALSGAVTSPVNSTVGLMGGILIAMWNYMGWDSASTIAAEVKNPQRTYPRAMLLSVIIVSATYILPVSAMWLTGISSAAFETGSWADLAALVGGPWLRVALVLGGLLSAFGMLNALVMSYSRLPLAMAQDGMLPPALARLNRKTDAPWVAILVCAAGWALCLGLGFERLITFDVLLSGASVVLEFAALFALRVKEPDLERPFRVAGGMPGAALIGVCPLLLLGISMFHSESERILGVNGLLFGVLLMVAGFIAYWAQSAIGTGVRLAPAPSDTPKA